MKKFSLPFAGIVLVAVLIASYTQTSVAADQSFVPGQYIVVLKDSVSDSAAVAEEMRRAHGLEVAFEYSHALKGFAARIPAARLEAVKADPRVAFVSEDRVVSAIEKPQSTGSRKGGGSPTQPPQVVPTGVSRVGAPVISSTGAGVGVAVIDTGIDLSHPDLAANVASASKTCVTRTRNANDDNGHGSHVAGTIAGIDNNIGVVGVAPQATLFAVKVLNKNGSGTWSSVICGIDWVTANAAANGIKVANMSLGGNGSSDNACGANNGDALHRAICNSTAAGVTYVVAAGNSGATTDTSVPAAYDDTVITVSALADSDGISGGLGASTGYGADDTFASFSNYGSAVDIGAPGVAIFSTWKGGGYQTISGTSMAAPHVAGYAALYLATHSGSLWTQVRDALTSAGETLGAGHTDPSGLHAEPVLQAAAL